MLNVDLNEVEGIAILEPDGELSESDFKSAAKIIDPYIEKFGEVHMRPFKKMGFYAAVKLLNVQKKVDGQKVIDFNESILLLGITYSFGF